MDLNMPGMDGNTTMTNIREYLFKNNAKQPIVSAVTGHLEQSYVDQAITMGMNQVLSKPVNPTYLSRLVLKLGYPTS